MLRPKRTSKEIELTYSASESRFTRDFYKGLILALIFHLLLLVVFRVKTTLDPRPKPFLPFTTVMAEVSKGVTASILSEHTSSPWDNEHSPTIPPLKGESIPTFNRGDFTHLENIEIDFSPLEKIPYKELLQGSLDD